MIVVSTGPEEPVEPYLVALIATGVDPQRIRVASPGTAQADVMSGATALLLCGGADVEPARYGEGVIENAGVSAVPARDALEWELLDVARERRTPVFGVCRGMQVLNVYFGGSLYQHLPLQRPGGVEHSIEPSATLAHAVFVELGEQPLARLLRREPCVVNSLHHQGVKNLASGLEAIAVSPDDVIEAVALRNGHGQEAANEQPWWVQAVQWHPENLLELPLQRELWRSFLSSTRAPA
ncbi:MAG: gamma-glutamyl-gamma-aminobutyrate hydrolase family protein [Acidobacteriota bacterium]